MVTLTEVFKVVEQLSGAEKRQLLDYLQQTKDEISESPKQRIAGLHAHLGPAWMSDDFNDPLPDSFWFGEE